MYYWSSYFFFTIILFIYCRGSAPFISWKWGPRPSKWLKTHSLNLSLSAGLQLWWTFASKTVGWKLFLISEGIWQQIYNNSLHNSHLMNMCSTHYHQSSAKTQKSLTKVFTTANSWLYLAGPCWLKSHSVVTLTQFIEFLVRQWSPCCFVAQGGVQSKYSIQQRFPASIVQSFKNYLAFGEKQEGDMNGEERVQ